MEVIVGSFGIDLTFECKYKELERLLTLDIEDVVLLHQEEFPYNIPTDKKATVYLEPDAKKLIDVEYIPEVG